MYMFPKYSRHQDNPIYCINNFNWFGYFYNFYFIVLYHGFLFYGCSRRFNVLCSSSTIPYEQIKDQF